ncbi:MAG TPA: DUF3857 and transglutaminase domain-containing protein [Pyrinomonadaceae bacterium]|nr:DUF3857 and transglutaminase domain-containing protein [Pyrinomonadaceae bacterium]
MKLFRSPLFSPLLFICLVAFAVSSASAQDWKPVTPEDLALKAPIVEKDADAEAIFWEVRVDDSQVDELSLKHYIRIKVFNERGRESQSKVDLPYLGFNKIKDVSARVIKADGTIVELKKDDVFERTIIKLSGLKVKAKSFALPGVEPGAIIEYRWREVHPGGSADRLRLQFQREIPVQTVTYFLRPYAGMQYKPFNMGEAKFIKDKDNFHRLTKTNMPAFREESKMPPEDEVRAWIFLFYHEGEKIVAEKYWKEMGKKIYELTKEDMKANDEVKAAAVAIVGDASTPEEKLKRIYEFCRTKIKNVNDDSIELTLEERSKFKENKSPADTLKREIGTGSNIDMLFAALARAAGFDSRLALSGNRDDLFFNKDLAHVSFLASSFVAVRVGEEWRFFSPAERYTPFGMLGWPEEGQEALITDSKEPVWVRTPVAPVTSSQEKRTGKFRLLEDGTLEGDVRIEYTGHLAAEKKEYNDDDSPSEREETLRNRVKEQMSTAELSDIKIENVTDPLKPFVYSFHVRVPGYAQRTGKRLFVQPAFFEHGVAPIFPTSGRTHAIYFHFPWSEEDTVTIQLPDGFSLDNPDSPAPFASGDITRYDVKIFSTKDERGIVYKRNFFFGGGGSGVDLERLYYDASGYSQLKGLFDAVHKQDNHTITLKQTASTASN